MQETTRRQDKRILRILRIQKMVLSQYEWYPCLCRISLLHPPSTIIPHLSHFILFSLVASDPDSYANHLRDQFSLSPSKISSSQKLIARNPFIHCRCSYPNDVKQDRFSFRKINGYRFDHSINSRFRIVW
jgi:hypothetical protein